MKNFEHRLKAVDRPCSCAQEQPAINSLWDKKKPILSQCNVGWRRLEEWRLEGLIRSVKLNAEKSGSRLYYLPDVQDVLLRLAAGQRPKPKLGRV